MWNKSCLLTSEWRWEEASQHGNIQAHDSQWNLIHENCLSWELSPPARNHVGKSVNWCHIQSTMLIIFFRSVPTPLPPPMSLWIGIRTGNVELDNRSSADSAHPQFSIRFQHLFFYKKWGGGHFIPIDNWATTEYWNEFHKKKVLFQPYCHLWRK